MPYIDDDIIELPEERLARYSPEEHEVVNYLRHCMGTADEKGMLARFIWQQIGFGRTTARDVGIVLGVFDPEGIVLDADSTYDGWSAGPDVTEQETLEGTEQDLDNLDREEADEEKTETIAATPEQVDEALTDTTSVSDSLADADTEVEEEDTQKE